MRAGITIDNSILMPNVPTVEPFLFEIQPYLMRRIGYNWEDDMNFYTINKLYGFQDISFFQAAILDFHPIHVALNSYDSAPYNAIKHKQQHISLSEIQIHKNQGLGTEVFLDEIVGLVKNHSIQASLAVRIRPIL